MTLTGCRCCSTPRGGPARWRHGGAGAGGHGDPAVRRRRVRRPDAGGPGDHRSRARRARTGTEPGSSPPAHRPRLALAVPRLSTRRCGWPARPRPIARDLGDPEVLGAVLLSERHLFSHPSRIDDRVRIGAELVALGRRLGRLAMTLGGCTHSPWPTSSVATSTRGATSSSASPSVLGDHSLGFFQIQVINHRANRAYPRRRPGRLRRRSPPRPFRCRWGSAPDASSPSRRSSPAAGCRPVTRSCSPGSSGPRVAPPTPGTGARWPPCRRAAGSSTMHGRRSTCCATRASRSARSIRGPSPSATWRRPPRSTGERSGRRSRPAGRRAVLRPDRRQRPVPGPAVRPGARPSVAGRRRPSGRRGATPSGR